MTFDPLVQAIRSSLRALDANPRAARAYLNLIEAYENCAEKESEAELLDQAMFVIQDVKKLSMTDAEKLRLAQLEARIAVTRSRLRPAAGGS
ncbi:MAG: hypothetical protein L0170_08920 [Acidobacteria bacterium]|nr:hypothetical protein [Acidobacteriota bacterium]